jgi:FlgD Ig-like domain
VNRSGPVSLAVYNSKNELVRTILSGVKYNAGTHTITWNGRDDSGAALPNGDYHWKLIQTGGLKAQNLMTVQTTLPVGTTGAHKERQFGIGNHDGPTALALQDGFLYISSGSSETSAAMLKMDILGERRIWSGAQPDISMGRHALAILGGKIYGLQQNGYVGVQGVEEPNWPYTAVSIDVHKGDYVGYRFDVLWPGARRGYSQDWEHLGYDPMDMTALNYNGIEQVVVSHFNHDAIRWHNARTGAVLATVSISKPKGLAVTKEGQVIVISNNDIFQILPNGQKTAIATGLNSPYRLDVDKDRGDILVYENGNSQQIKRFSSNGSLLKTYGKLGGRDFGLYQPNNFISVTDLISDNKGGFFVTERNGARRIGHFNYNGDLIKEWYAGSIWSPSLHPEPKNPSVAWGSGAKGEVVRYELNLDNKTWKVHSIYSLSNSSKNVVNIDFDIDQMGAGISGYKPFRINGRLYLAEDSTSQGRYTVFILDEVNWNLKLSAYSSFQEDNRALFHWGDINGDGLMQPNEKRSFSNNIYGYTFHNFRPDQRLNYFALNEFSNSITRIKVTGFTAAGAPIYEDLPQNTGGDLSKITFAKLPSEVMNGSSISKYYGANNKFSFDEQDGSVYLAIGVGDKGWSGTDFGLILKYSSLGNLVWKKRMGVSGSYSDVDHTYVRGEQTYSTFRNNVGVVYGNFVSQDFNGAHEGYAYPGITYVFDKDGLWVGELLENPDLNAKPLEYYKGCSENGAGDVIEDPKDRDAIFYFSGTENATQLHRITGFSNWLRLKVDFKIQ